MARLDLPAAGARIAQSTVLSEDVSRLKYVSGSREEALRRLQIQTVRDLLYHIPRRYLDFSRSLTIEAAPLGLTCTIVATVDRVVVKRPRPRLSIVEVSLVDDTGVLKAPFFKQPWIADQLKRGDRVAVMGKVEFSYGFKQMASPIFEKLESHAFSGRILPVHPASEGVSPAWMRRIISTALEAVIELPDPLPARLRARRGVMSIGRALRAIHFPAALPQAELARRRLSYEEVLYLQLALRLRNDANLLDIQPISHVADGPRIKALRRTLPFSLSTEQEAAASEILADMHDGSRVMNRMLLGDVGTGKTAVASLALATAADSGFQACMMAPTGVLAQQYAVKLGPLLDEAGIRWELLMGGMPPSERGRVVDAVAAGSVDVLFGTHAVLSDDVRFKRLSLVVIDEQHRFGVGQRAALRAKGPGADLLVMTATPIPRTLALSVYGDLDASIIRHRPVPGAGVSTKVLDAANRDIAYGAIRDAVAQGHQAYVICPLVSPQDPPDVLEDVPGVERGEDGAPLVPKALHSVEEEAVSLERIFPDLRVRMLHGRMSDAQKDEVLTEFRAGGSDILVSTTVVEVGVDVPNATVMVVENGERFGLATLHQLRGRVGRGSYAGRCFVLNEQRSPKGAPSPAAERLRALEKTSDGFSLAEMDLRLRHEGEILGLRQHGGTSLRFVDLDVDGDLIEAAHDDAVSMLRGDRELSSTPLHPLRYEVVDRYGDIFKEVSGG